MLENILITEITNKDDFRAVQERLVSLGATCANSLGGFYDFEPDLVDGIDLSNRGRFYTYSSSDFIIDGEFDDDMFHDDFSQYEIISPSEFLAKYKEKTLRELFNDEPN